LDGIVAGFGVEWRIKPNFTLDAATPANLYGSTPTTIAQRRSSSSGPASGTLVGLDAEIVARTSYDEYASTVYVSSQGGIGGAGGAAQFRDAQGNFPTIVRMVDSSNTPPGTEVAVATTLVNQYGNVAGNRTVTVDVRRYGLTRILKAGSYLYLYDPEFGLYAVGGSPLRHDGSAVFPATTRVLGVRWPIERGMGVLVRYWDNATAAFRYADLTPYVEFEDGTASLEVV